MQCESVWRIILLLFRIDIHEKLFVLQLDGSFLWSWIKGLKEIISSHDHIRCIRFFWAHLSPLEFFFCCCAKLTDKLLLLFQVSNQGESSCGTANTRYHLCSTAGLVRRVANRARMALFVSPRVPRQTTCLQRRPRPNLPMPSLHCSLRLGMALSLLQLLLLLQKLLKSERSIDR